MLSMIGAVGQFGGGEVLGRLPLPGRQVQAGFERIDPKLADLHVSAQGGRQALAVEAFSTGLKPLIFDGADRVGVTVTTTDVGRITPALQGLGFQVSASMPGLHFVEGFLPIGSLPAAASLTDQGLLGIVANYRPMTSVGLVTSQADFVLEADRVRNSVPGLDGSGVKVGIISDSFNRLGGYATDIATGDLPADVQIVREGPTSGVIDEGRAMAQLVHDLAPGSPLGFGSAAFGQGAFGQIIRDLANPSIFGASVITDDIFYFEEPQFQDGVIAQAIDEVFDTRNVSYFSSAGNIASQAWETASPNFGAFDPQFSDTFLDFNPGAATDTRQRITLAPGQQAILSLQWDDPFYTASGVQTDLDIYVLDVAANQFVAFSVRDNIALQFPSEIVGFGNPTGSTRAYDIFVVKFTGPDPGRVKWVNHGANTFGNLPFVEYATNSPTVTPHAAARGAMAVAAAPFFNQRTPAAFTSHGPNTILFSPSGVRLASAEVRQTPDITATDGTDTTFFGTDATGSGFPNFFGTSAAAPHAAAVAALLRQSEPGLSAQGVQDRLTSTAIDINTVGFDNRTGFGLVDAFAAVLGPTVPASLPLADGFESGALSVNWETNRFGSGRTLVTGAFGPDSGAYHLTMDSSVTGVFGLNEAILRFDATTAAGDVMLSFRQREFNDFDDPMPATFVGSIAADGVALSVDGLNWVRIVSLTGSASQNVYQGFEFNLTEIAAAAGLTLGADTRVKFQQFDLGMIPNDGFAFDAIQVTSTATAPTRLDAIVLNPTILDRPEQRSTVRSIAVDVIGPVASFSPSAFALTRSQDGQAFGVVVDSIALLDDGRSRILLSFTGAGLEGGSLPDGDYTLVVDGAGILDPLGRALDADGDGSPGGTATESFHRLFGDTDGDRDVDASDLLVLRWAIANQALAFASYLDFDNNGTIDSADIAAFNARRGRRL